MESKSTKILVVEDNTTCQNFLMKWLNKKGINCDVASNGQEAISLWESNNYDIIFMDCDLPLVNGLDVTRYIREHEDCHNFTPIIAITSCCMKGDEEKCLDAGMNVYVPKPVNLQVLDKIVYGCLSGLSVSEELDKLKWAMA